MGGFYATYPVRWKFVQESEKQWVWHRLKDDGELVETSQSLPDFGAAIWDALRGGFSPKKHSWVVITRQGVSSHFGATGSSGGLAPRTQ